jgi:hypothetical protein
MSNEDHREAVSFPQVSDKLAAAIHREADRLPPLPSSLLMFHAARAVRQIDPELFDLDNPADQLIWVLVGD